MNITHFLVQNLIGGFQDLMQKDQKGKLLYPAFYMAG